jgi:uncharacterized protein (DUF58 family)
MPEDSARHVDWKSTAKSGSLKVREFNREEERKLCIVFDNPESGLISVQTYERAVNLAASLAWHFCEQNAQLSFAVPGHPRFTDLHQFLACLALIEPQQDSPSQQMSVYSDVFQEAAPGNTGAYNIVLTARSRGALPTASWNSSYFVFIHD